MNPTRALWAMTGITLSTAVGCDWDRGFGDDTTLDFSIESFTVGSGAGFGSDDIFERINAGPFGGGDVAPSSDVVSLGISGEIVLSRFVPIRNTGGPDFVIFENPFLTGTSPDSVFAEPAQVSVSASGETWHDFPCDATAYPYVGCAGVRPVYANVETNDISPLDFDLAGGDVFDLSDAGIASNATIRFIRITDVAGRWGEAGTSGFDLDAIWAR